MAQEQRSFQSRHVAFHSMAVVPSYHILMLRSIHVCRLLVDCNQLAVDIDAELSAVHNWVRKPLRCTLSHRVLAAHRIPSCIS